MYQITRDYIRMGNSRSGQKISKVRFIVSHDTGNAGSTAYQNWNYFNRQQPSASAHTFIDDKYILEMIPLNEKAWHVQSNKPMDNRLFGANANDAAIGVELCWGGNIKFEEAYKRYVWYHAHLCKTFNLDPRKHIVAHKTLDPERRTDPVDCLKRHGITWEQFINEVVKAMSPRVSYMVRTGGVTPDMIKELSTFLIQKKWGARLHFPGATPYFEIFAFPHGSDILAEMEQWLKARNWAYELQEI